MTLDIKSLVYQRLQPYAKALGMKLLVVDRASYRAWDKSLQKKATRFGISDDAIAALSHAVKDYSCVALLKSSTYLGTDEVASAFSKAGADADDINMLTSKNASKSPVWGDLDVRNNLFIYWIPIDVESFSGTTVIDEEIEQFDGMYGSKVKRVKPISFRGIDGFITAGDLIEAIENVWPGQENAVFNFGPNGHIYGQVNQVFDENGLCILGLAPYKNGSRSRDLSINGIKDAPLAFKQLKPMLARMSPDATVFIRMRDPNGFGPNAGRIIQQPANSIDIDDKWGIFIRTDDNQQEIVR